MIEVFSFWINLWAARTVQGGLTMSIIHPLIAVPSNIIIKNCIFCILKSTTLLSPLLGIGHEGGEALAGDHGRGGGPLGQVRGGGVQSADSSDQESFLRLFTILPT